MNFLETIFWLIPIFVVVGPILTVVFGLFFYVKCPQFRLWIGLGLIFLGLWGLIAYLEPINNANSRRYSFDYPWYWYLVPLFEFASIFIGLFAIKNRIKDASKQI